MIKRFQRIRREFGTMIFLRIALLPVGLVGMTLLGYFGLSSVLAGLIALAGLALGFMLREHLVLNYELYSPFIKVGLFVSGVVLFLGDLFGFERNLKLAVITATTVIIFDLQFWSLSDERIVNIERDDEE